MPAAPRRTTVGKAHAWRRLIVRLIATFSCLIALVGIGGSYVTYRRIADAERVAQQQLGQISADFAQVADTLNTVSISATNAATSVGEARTALNDTSKTTRDIAVVLDQTAGVINFTIPGLNIRPLAGVDTSFRDQARQLRDVAGQVDRTSGALDQNGRDLRAISGDVATMSGEIRGISEQLRTLGAGPNSPLATTIGGTRIVLLWTGTIHLLLLALGLALWLLTIEDRPLPESPPAAATTPATAKSEDAASDPAEPDLPTPKLKDGPLRW